MRLRITQDTHFDAFLTFHSFPSFIPFLFLQGSLKPRTIYYANGLNLKYNFKMTKDIQQPTVKRKMLKKQKKKSVRDTNFKAFKTDFL